MEGFCRSRVFASGLAMTGLLAVAFVSCDKSPNPTAPNSQQATTAANTGGNLAGGDLENDGATLVSDAADYAPGATATLTGAGFGTGEDVTLVVLHSDGTPSTGSNHEPWTVSADSSGGFVTTWLVCADDCVGATLLATADGQSSGLHAEVGFTDTDLGTGRVSSVTALDGGCVREFVPGANGVISWDVQQGKTYRVTLTNVTECSGGTIEVIVKNSDNGNQCLTATSTGNAGEYTFDVTMPANACNTSPILYCTTGCSESSKSGRFARRSDGANFQSHLRAATFDGNCENPVSDTDCGGGNECSLDIACPPDATVACASEVPAPDPSSVVVTTTGDCDPVTVTWEGDEITNQTCANQYSITRTYLATAGTASATCTQTISVFDDVVPTVACPSDIVVSLVPGDACPAVVEYSATGEDNCGGAVTVTCVPPSGSTFPVGTTVVTCTAVDECGNESSCSFNVTVYTSVCAVKFYDANVNGIDDDGLWIANWRFDLSGDAADTAYTDANGKACFTDLAAGTYTVTEVMPSASWLNTTATSCTVDLGCPHICSFGNVCLGAGGGKTLGFWSNKNGQTKMNDDGGMGPELALLSSLCLRNASGADFDPGAYNPFRTWLLNATAVNMAYMLSAQLAAMELNVEAGYVYGGRLVYMPGCGNTGVNNDFISINDLMAAAAAALCADGYTPDGDPNRAMQECLKTALDRANNNLNFVQAGPCADAGLKAPVTTQ